jgi:hypothetical protein
MIPADYTINFTPEELEAVTDALWHWCACPSGVTNQKAKNVNVLRRRLLAIQVARENTGAWWLAHRTPTPEST